MVLAEKVRKRVCSVDGESGRSTSTFSEIHDEKRRSPSCEVRKVEFISGFVRVAQVNNNNRVASVRGVHLVGPFGFASAVDCKYFASRTIRSLLVVFLRCSAEAATVPPGNRDFGQWQHHRIRRRYFKAEIWREFFKYGRKCTASLGTTRSRLLQGKF